MEPESTLKPEIIRLNLLSPLFYVPDESIVPGFGREDEEKLFCFELEDPLGQEFQPDKKRFPGALVFAGKAAASEALGESIFELTPGDYIFSQVREILGIEEIVELAVEVQDEGLWQRLKLAKRFYVRYLFEENRGVTQIWRPYTC
jgi:hypothetical protein